MASNPVASGPTAERVAKNIERVRKSRQLHQKDVSELLKDVGRPMLPTTVSKMERGERRIDVDDLVALALVLNVSPLTLLLPDDSSQEPVKLTEEFEVASLTAWQWGEGQRAATGQELRPVVDYGPGGDPTTNAQAYENQREFDREQTEYVALARPEARRRAENHSVIRALNELRGLIEDILDPEPGADPATLAARGRMAQRRHTQLGLGLEEIIERLPPARAGVPLPGAGAGGQGG